MTTATLNARSGDGLRRIASSFEFWPSWVFRTPIVLQWLMLGAWYRDFSLPTAANPLIEMGGLCGETKSSILDQAGPDLKAATARYVVTARDPDAAAAAMTAAALAFPVVLKPDIGCNGSGVRLVSDAATLRATLPLYPVGAAMMLQAFIPDEGEAGIFYVRSPGQSEGRITSLTLKRAPNVVGDGRSTLRELILQDPRASLASEMYFPRLGARLGSVPAAGEQVRLVLVGNHCRGSIFTDAADSITPALTAQVERLARDLPEFHFGRFDVRFGSLAALRRGEDFTVIEVNGVGAEATHVWDAEANVWSAWRDQFAHFAQAFAIGARNRARGFRSSGVWAMFLAFRRQSRLMRCYPVSD